MALFYTMRCFMLKLVLIYAILNGVGWHWVCLSTLFGDDQRYALIDATKRPPETYWWLHDYYMNTGIINVWNRYLVHF